MKLKRNIYFLHPTVMASGFEATNASTHIIIKGARTHNLKSIDIAIPRNRMTVVTGLSGSGKSSLAFDTLFAEGQRRYVESLSSYARQFLGKMPKPEVDFIKGIAPAVAVQQKVIAKNPRSTVGTSTEIYDYLKLLFARIGKTYSPVSGNLVKRHTVTDVVDFILTFKEQSKLLILSPLQYKTEKGLLEQLTLLIQQGFSRILVNDSVYKIEDFVPKSKIHKTSKIFIVVDRIVVEHVDEFFKNRLADSVQTAFYEGQGYCYIKDLNLEEKFMFSHNFEADGITFEEPSVSFFSFNNPYGACKKCEGYGSVIGIDEDLVIPDKSLSIYDNAIACWRGEKMSEWNEQLVMNAYKFDFPIHKPVSELSREQMQLLWDGNEHFNGLNAFFKHVEEQTYKIQYRVMLSRYRGKTVCPDCKGTRLRQDAAYVKIADKSIIDLLLLPVNQLVTFFDAFKPDNHDYEIAKRLLIEINNRLHYLMDVGLGYLTLNRLSSSLSGGESQRIQLATSLGSSLVGAMYILDEPSIGLHSRDTQRLIQVLKRLRDLGNTVIVVEHDEEIMRAADFIVDIGPEAGINGGQVIAHGSVDAVVLQNSGYTAKYLAGELKIPVPKSRRKWKEFIEVQGARENNLKSLDVKFPLEVMTVVTGVSGSGKTSLVKTVLYGGLKRTLGLFSDFSSKYDKIVGDLTSITDLEMVDQNPIGRSSRSNPVTYLKAFDDIRELYAAQQLAKLRGYKPGFFSFNIEGGRCETCQGEGEVTIEMQFMADIKLICEECGGKRYKQEALDVKYKGKDISDILDLTVDEALEFFSNTKEKNQIEKRIIAKLNPLSDVGMGYVKLGQSSSTLSGGEAQRVKLAYFLSKGESQSKTLFIFDEPTTGLHFYDINNLLKAMNALVDRGHTVIVIEHNMEIIKAADWIIDMGPEGGESGGRIVFEGTPEKMVQCKESVTASFLKEKL